MTELQQTIAALVLVNERMTGLAELTIENHAEAINASDPSSKLSFLQLIDLKF